MAKITITDRLDRSFHITAEHGDPISQWMLRNYIPSSSIILTVNDKIVDDSLYTISDSDEIKINLVRAYQLPEYCGMLNLWGDTREPSASNNLKSIYTAQALWYNENGVCELKKSHMGEEDFVQYIEDKFSDGIVETNLFEDGQDICLALSGGRDSMALLYLLSRCKNKIPKHNIIGCTVSPSAASQSDVAIAQEAIKNLGVTDYSIISLEEVNKVMNFTNGFDSAINAILKKYGKGYSIACWHGIMRSCVENFAKKRGLNTVAFGYQHEDLIASVFRSQNLGIWFGETAQKKSWGDLTIISPLWTITKKELTIYLNLVAPESHSQQGSPTNFDRGDHNRDINYFAADMLASILPGFGFELFEGLKNSGEREKSRYYNCVNCGTIFTDLGFPDRLSNDKLCHTCEVMRSNNEIDCLTRVK